MILKNQPYLRRLLLIGTPLLTGILLLFHPLPEGAETVQMGQLDNIDGFTPSGFIQK